MKPFARDPLAAFVVRALVALLLVAAATLARAAVDPVLQTQTPFAFHVVAVMAGAWLAGLDGAMVATVGSALAVNYFFMEPRWSFAIATTSDRAATIIFALVCGAIGWQTSRWRTAERALVGGREAQRYRAERLEVQAEQLQRAHDALRANERRLSALMNATTESIWLLDRDAVLAANATAAERVGLPLDKVVGMRWREWLPPELAALRGARVDEVFATGRAVRFEDVRGEMRYDHTFYPVFDDRGSVVAVASFSRDVTEQRRTEEGLREVSQRLAYHVNHSPLAVIEFGADERITRWTGAAARLFGWSAEEVLGRTAEEFRWVYEEDAAQVSDAMLALRTGSEEGRFTANRYYRKDGSVVFCEWYNSALFDEAGRLGSVLSLVLDVTDRKRLDHELRAQAQQLSTANRLKDDFLATLSHELRTPINAILGWAQILTLGDLPPERVCRGLDTIARNARLQAQMVEDLLDVSRIVTGSLRLDIQPVDVRPLVDQALDAVRPGCEAKQIAVSVSVEPGLTLSADAVRLQQVLWNLLSNGVKFTPAGGSIRVWARRAGSDVEISVSDTGPGIRPNFLPHVFERFRQGDSSPTRAHAGLGLGLAIVRHIVELHGGTVSVESEGEGRGAVFTVRLPARTSGVATTAVPGLLAAAPPTREAALADVRVLAVDDDADAREVVASMLSAAGAQVECAASARQARDVLEWFRPQVLVSDIAMPEVDGYALIRELRAGGSPVAGIPAVAVTAYGGAADWEAALAAGYDRHIAKPIVADQLVSTVASLVSNPRVI